MSSLMQTLVVLALIWVFAYRRAHMGTILISIAAALLAMTWYGGIAWLLWLALAVVAFFYFEDNFRREKLTKPVYKFFQGVLPPMSETEQEALEAGDTWWEADLFKGAPDWKKWLAIPFPTLSQAEEDFLNNQTEQLCQMLNDWNIVHIDKDLSKEAWEFLKKEKFFGMIIPEEYGGLGFSALAHSTVVTKIATRSCSAAVTAMVPNSLGPAELLMKYGTEAQRQHYLPRLACGEDIPCFALTGPEAGSDAGAMTDTGIVCMGEFEGKQCLGLSLTWNKRYITLAPVATVVGLAFKMVDPDHLLSDVEERGITVALIPAAHPGVQIGNRHFPMGMTFMNGPTRGENVFIPLEWIIGGVERAGQGWRMLVECLSEGRAISLPALSTATGKLCYRMTGAYARIRSQFNLAIGNFEGVEEALARIAGHAYQLEATRIVTAGAVDSHIKPSVVSAIAKYHMTEKSRSVIQDAMDVHAGRGLIMGPANYLAHAYMSMPIGITVEGANILTRNLMIFGQGAVRCHPFVAREMQAAKNPDAEAGLRDFDSLIFRHFGYGISNFVRTLSLGISAGLAAGRPVKDATGCYYQQLTRMSSALALVSDISMLMFGGELKRKERLSARLGDVLSQLYLASTALRYYESNGRDAAELPYVKWNLQLSLYHCQCALNEFFDNLPNRVVATILKKVVFPWGDAYRRPDDRLDHELVQTMWSDTEIRKRITRYTFIGNSEKDAAFVIEDAFRKITANKPIRDNIRAAIKQGRLTNTSTLEATAAEAVSKGVCSVRDSEDYVEAERTRDHAIQVDEHISLQFSRT
ncbi:MAG: acyl-CoA dehydrogenase [Gammaproteobacteria bacterium]|nr:acyl-CoA dehydrogenase [Gammaproteobacteria bacterium]MDP2347197.1 acyl-CoA dehydrogenase [Gammaproteobacteria bacterium]